MRRSGNSVGDVVTEGAGAAAGGACATQLGPLAAPACAWAASEFVGGLEKGFTEFFGGGSCSGWVCTQAPPNEVMDDMIAKRGQAFGNAVQAAYDAWAATPEVAIFSSGIFNMKLDFPSETYARAIESRFFEVTRDALAKQIDTAAASGGAPVAGTFCFVAPFVPGVYDASGVCTPGALGPGGSLGLASSGGGSLLLWGGGALAAFALYHFGFRKRHR